MELTKKQLIKLVQFATGKIHSSFTWESEAEDTVDEYLKAINYTHCCDKLPNIESEEFCNWMTDNGYTDEQHGTMQKGDERYCINNLFKHYQNLLEFGN